MPDKNRNGNKRKVYVRPVDVAEFIYNILSKKELLSKEIKDLLETIIVDLKDEKFGQLAEKWGVDPWFCRVLEAFRRTVGYEAFGYKFK